MAEDQAIPIQNQSNPDSKTVDSSNLEVKIESITPVSNVNGPWKGKFANIMEQHDEVKLRQEENEKLENSDLNKSSKDEEKITKINNKNIKDDKKLNFLQKLLGVKPAIKKENNQNENDEIDLTKLTETQKQEILKVEKQLQSLLGGKLIITKRADFQMEQAFTSTAPLCLDQVEIFRNMNTSPLSTTFPFSSSDLTSNDGILYGINRHNDGLIIFDRFSLENANSVVFAKSGAGKSYAVKLEILRSLMIGSDVIIIDPENEYEALANTVGGTYLRVSLNSDRRINPFDLPKPIDEDEMKPGDLLRSAVINLSGLLKLMFGETTP